MSEPLSKSNKALPTKAASRKPSSRTPQTSMAQPAAIAADVVGQMAAALGPVSDNMGTLAAEALKFANPDRGELVVDIAALASAFLKVRTSGRVATAPMWLQQWVSQQGHTFLLRSTPVYEHLRPALSASVRGNLLPRAVQLRDITMGSTPEPVGMRHLLFALAEQPAGKWPPLMEGRRLTPNDLRAIREMIVERTGANPLPGENMAAWQGLLGLQATAPASPPPTETTPLLSDNPADADTLGRQPLADALAARLVRLQAGEAASADPRAIMVHLHGAWGAGKSSMVRFLSARLGREHPRWLLVDFNAWRNARVKPPWWNMLTEYKRALSRRLLADVRPLGWLWLQLRWAWVSPSVDNAVLVAGVLLSAALLLLFGKDIAEVKAAMESGPALLTLATGTIAAVAAGVRALLLGGKRTAESFDALRTDSFRPFISLFDMLVNASPCPVLIVLDDLDRCDAATVTDLLEGIQTLFRGQPVVFLAVADRHWITTSFAERFRLFDANGDQARPLGDLFLDKMFQLSVAIPALPALAKQAYLDSLLGRDAAAPAAPAYLPAGANSHEAVNEFIANAEEAARPALRAQAVARTATPQADKVIEHRLVRWIDHIEPNPRGMKRLVNAIGMVQAKSILEGREADFDTIVLWTILELRWPRAADALIGDPTLIDDEGGGPVPLAVAWTDPMFRKLAAELDASKLRALLGSEDDEAD
jgi:hypothetical protein